MVTALISGTIKNTKNSRGTVKGAKGYIPFTLKEKLNKKVTYCYLPTALADSRWFAKGQTVNLEVKNATSVNNHSAYEVVTLWNK